LPFGDHPASEADAPGDGDRDHPDGAVDPHFFTDPARMAVAARATVDFLAGAVPALDTAAFRARGEVRQRP